MGTEGDFFEWFIDKSLLTSLFQREELVPVAKIDTLLRESEPALAACTLTCTYGSHRDTALSSGARSESSLCCKAALMNPLNIGWQSSGRDLNSG